MELSWSPRRLARLSASSLSAFRDRSCSSISATCASAAPLASAASWSCRWISATSDTAASLLLVIAPSCCLRSELLSSAALRRHSSSLPLTHADSSCSLVACSSRFTSASSESTACLASAVVSKLCLRAVPFASAASSSLSSSTTRAANPSLLLVNDLSSSRECDSANSFASSVSPSCSCSSAPADSAASLAAVMASSFWRSSAPIESAASLASDIAARCCCTSFNLPLKSSSALTISRS
mmetsp:Transcript_3607/g.8624  ORF Transcript_3607/g.8624 Transcript_3607/m.8624 type:complete len:240 (+) Transcript_3607:110-829(+)